MPAFYYIPKAALAAVIICAVTPMVDYGAVAQMWRIRSMFTLHRQRGGNPRMFPSREVRVCSSELDLLPFAATFLMSFWQVQYGIIGGVVVSGVLLMYDTARPRIQVPSVSDVCDFT